MALCLLLYLLYIPVQIRFEWTTMCVYFRVFRANTSAKFPIGSLTNSEKKRENQMINEKRTIKWKYPLKLVLSPQNDYVNWLWATQQQINEQWTSTKNTNNESSTFRALISDSPGGETLWTHIFGSRIWIVSAIISISFMYFAFMLLRFIFVLYSIHLANINYLR